MTLYRVELRGNVQYQRVKKRNTYTVVYLDNEGQNRFALIENFVFIHKKIIAILTALSPLPIICKEKFGILTTALDNVSFLTRVKTRLSSVLFCARHFNLFLDFSSVFYIVQLPSCIAFD